MSVILRWEADSRQFCSNGSKESYNLKKTFKSYQESDSKLYWSRLFCPLQSKLTHLELIKSPSVRLAMTLVSDCSSDQAGALQLRKWTFGTWRTTSWRTFSCTIRPTHRVFRVDRILAEFCPSLRGWWPHNRLLFWLFASRTSKSFRTFNSKPPNLEQIWKLVENDWAGFRN